MQHTCRIKLRYNVIYKQRHTNQITKYQSLNLKAYRLATTIRKHLIITN